MLKCIFVGYVYSLTVFLYAFIKSEILYAWLLFRDTYDNIMIMLSKKAGEKCDEQLPKRNSDKNNKKLPL